MKANKITQLSDIEHVLQRSGIYIGSTVPTACSTFVFNKNDEKFEYKEIVYNPGFLKIIYEIIDNSLDEAIRTNFKFGTKIDVSIKKNTVSVIDNGRGIPLDIADGSDISQFELALTSLRAGSNFNDADGRNLLGMNGVGSSLTNIFSKSFKATVYDGKRKGVLTCKNNLSSKKCIIEDFKSKEHGTAIEFTPDLSRFNMENIDEIHENLIHQRLMFLSYMYPEITFKFNGKIVRFKSSKNFMSIFSDKSVAIVDDNKPCKFMIGIIPNNNDDFTHKSYINGADCINGGNHLDYIHSELIGRIKDKLSKKYSSIKPGDIKNKLTYIVMFREFINPMFNSQTKENFSSDVSEIKQFLTDVDWDSFAQKIVKCPEIMNPILETYKIKEELKNRQTLEKIGKTKAKFKCDKFLSATKNNTYFLICEGLSASAGLSACLGRSDFGYYSTRGVPLNAYEATINKLADNVELSDMIKLLNLQFNKAEALNLTYENIVIATDADCFREDTYVLTKHGHVKLKDIKYGDELLTHTGNYKPVIDIIERTKNLYIKLEVENDVLYMSHYHKLIVYRNNEITVVEAKDLLLSDLLIDKLDGTNYSPMKFLRIKHISNISSIEPETFIDINVQDDHSFYVYLENSNKYVLSKNCDGSHITGLYLGFFAKYYPNLIKSGKIKHLRTPIITFKDNKDNIKHFFFTFDEYNKFIKNNDVSKLKIHYYKGLGSWEPKDLKPLVEKYGINYFLETFTMDNEGETIIDNWLNSKNADKRKEYLSNKEFNIFNI